MGNTDRIIRITLAVVLVVLFVNHIISGILGIILLIVTGIFILTSLVGYCPIYKPLGINTRDKKLPK